MAKRLNGRVAAITGTGGGQGRAAALLFAAEGAVIVGCDLKAGDSDETVEMVRAAGGTMTSMHPLDLTDQGAVQRWIDQAVEQHGRLDILYNNAAGPRFAPLMDMPTDDWHYTLRNELDIIFYAVKAVWPHLIEGGGGSIVNTASIQGVLCVQPTVGAFAHAAAKGGLIAMTRELANEGSPHGIRVNAVSPGLIMSPGTAEWVNSMPGYLDAFVERQLVKRPGQPEDIARAALFLASDDAAFISGQNLIVDGGYSAV